MARVELSESWTAGGQVSSLQSKVHQFFRAHRMRVIGERAGEVHARQGSRLLTWLFGFRLARPQWLPKRAFVKLKAADGGVTLRAGIEDGEEGKELSPVVRAKYEAYFARWMKELKNEIGETAT